MINHARCLLLNVDGSTPYLAGLGSEIIDPSYRTRPIPGALAAAHRVIFGANPDRHMLNYRAFQLLSIIHASRFDGLITALDRRISYDVSLSPFFDDALYDPQVSVLSGSGTLVFVGEPSPPDGSGQTEYRWKLSVDDGSNATLTLTNPLQATTLAYTKSGSMSTQLAIPWLPGQSVMFTGDSGAVYEIASRVRPRADLMTVLTQLQGLGDGALSQIFGVTDGRSKLEPFASLYAAWKTHPEALSRLSALVLAMIYWMNEL